MRIKHAILLAWVSIAVAYGIDSYAKTKNSPVFDDVTVNGQLTINGGVSKFESVSATSPTIGSCGGGSPSVAGTDNSMLLTMGTGTLTQCTVTFATVWPNAPHCVMFPANTTAAATGTTGAYVFSIATNILTIKGSNLTSAAYQVLCW